MKNKAGGCEGYLILDVLITLMILAVVFAVFMGAMAQSAKVSALSARTTDAISSYDEILFQMQSGIRLDLAGYGGEGALNHDYVYKIISLQGDPRVLSIRNVVSLKTGKEILKLDAVVSNANIQ